MKVVVISDTHNQHDKIEVPDGDLLIHCGDFSGRGTEEDLVEFNRWLGTLPHQTKILVPGNHDSIVEEEREYSKELLTNAVLLIDEEVSIDGIRIYGMPWTPEFGRWSFMLPRGPGMKSVCSLIPDGLDVLVTHGPPYGIQDEVLRYTRQAEWEPENVGCKELLSRVLDARPRFHLFGHIHEGYGTYKGMSTTFFNAATCTGSYRPINKAMEFEL